MKNAHEEFLSSENWGLIEEARQTGYARFLSQRNAVINLFRTSRGSEDFILKLKNVIQATA
jgi:hypothetical protein